MRRAVGGILLALLVTSPLPVAELAAAHRPYPFGYYGPFHRYPFAYRYYRYQPRTYPLHLWSFPYGSTYLGQAQAYDWVYDTIPMESEILPASATRMAPTSRLRVDDPVSGPFGW